MTYDIKTSYSENNLVTPQSYVYISLKSSGDSLFTKVDSKNEKQINWTKYQIKETDMRQKTANLTTPVQLDLTEGVHIIRIVSALHENFIGEILTNEYDEDAGLYTYQCQDLSREYQSKFDLIVKNANVYRVLKTLLTAGRLGINTKLTKSINEKYRQYWRGLRPLELYNQKLWSNPVNFNPMTLKNNMILRDVTYMEAIRNLALGSGAFVDVYFSSDGTLQIEPFSAEEWKSNGLYLTTEELASRKFKFDTTNTITNAVINSADNTKTGRQYTSKSLLNLNLAMFFGNLYDSASNPSPSIPASSKTTTNAVKTSTTTKKTKVSDNPYGKKKKRAWINADGGSDSCKKKLANALKKKGWSVHVSGTGPGYHYKDYFNVTKDYQVLIQIQNGFCAGTIREAYSDKIQNVLKKKGVVLISVFDTATWNDPKGMKPYKYGDFSKYNAKRAWDDNFSSSDPSIKNVGDFFKKKNAIYCASPSVDGILQQFLAGGYFKYKQSKTTTKTTKTSKTTTKNTNNYAFSTANAIELEKVKARELITDSSRDYLTLKLTIPLGNPNLKKVHTNQFLWTELPKEFSLEFWEIITEVLGSGYTRYAGYELNRWYIEGVSTSVEIGGKAEMTLDLNAFASSISKYKEGKQKLAEAYNQAITNNNKTANSSTKTTSKAKTNAVTNGVNKTLKGGQGKTIDNLVKKIVGSETNELKKAKLIHEWLKKEVRYSCYTCSKYKNAETAYKNRRHLNCADTAILTTAMMKSAGLKAYWVHRTYNGGHFWTVIEIKGKKYASDQTGDGSSWNTVWKRSGRTTVSDGGAYSNKQMCYGAGSC